jgi:hypothetical protein
MSRRAAAMILVSTPLRYFFKKAAIQPVVTERNVAAGSVIEADTIKIGRPVNRVLNHLRPFHECNAGGSQRVPIAHPRHLQQAAPKAST